ncbi:MAG: hypothetical protein ABIP48_19445 [Planctomycetota bacterium]
MKGKQRMEDGHEARNSPHGKRKPRRTEDVEKWIVVVLKVAKREGRKILTDLQYDHIVDILKRLVDFGNPEEMADLDIKPIGSFYELKEKWGVLGRINLRVYFGTISEDHELVIAKTYKKEDDGPTPRHIVILVEERLEEYRAGGLRNATSVHQEATPRK